MQDGATPAVLASKAGHREIADLIAAGGSAAARHHLPTQEPPRVRTDHTPHVHDQLQPMERGSSSQPTQSLCPLHEQRKASNHRWSRMCPAMRLQVVCMP